MLNDNTSFTGGNPVYLPLQWCHICKKCAFFLDELMSDCQLAKLHSVMFPHCANKSCEGKQIQNIKMDRCSDGVTFWRQCDGVRQHLRHEKNSLVITGANAKADAEMRLCNHWQSHVFTVWTKASPPKDKSRSSLLNDNIDKLPIVDVWH